MSETNPIHNIGTALDVKNTLSKGDDLNKLVQAQKETNLSRIGSVFNHVEAVGHTMSGEHNDQEHVDNLKRDTVAVVRNYSQSKKLTETFRDTKELEKNLNTRLSELRGSQADINKALANGRNELSSVNKQLFDARNELNKYQSATGRKRMAKLKQVAEAAKQQEVETSKEIAKARSRLKKLDTASSEYREAKEAYDRLNLKNQALKKKRIEYELNKKKQAVLKEKVRTLSENKAKLKAVVDEMEARASKTASDLKKAEEELAKTKKVLADFDKKASPSVKKKIERYQKKQLQRSAKSSEKATIKTVSKSDKIATREAEKATENIRKAKKNAAIRANLKKKAAIKRSKDQLEKKHLLDRLFSKNGAKAAKGALAKAGGAKALLAGGGVFLLILLGLAAFLLLIVVIVEMFGIKLNCMVESGQTYNVKNMVLEAENTWTESFQQRIDDIKNYEDFQQYDMSHLRVAPVNGHIKNCFAVWYACRTVDAFHEISNASNNVEPTSDYRFCEDLGPEDGYNGSNIDHLYVFSVPGDFYSPTVGGGSVGCCFPARGLAWNDSLDWPAINQISEVWDDSMYSLMPTDYASFFSIIQDMNTVLLLPETTTYIDGYSMSGEEISHTEFSINVIVEYTDPFDYIEQRGYSEQEVAQIRGILENILVNQGSTEYINFERLWAAIHRQPSNTDVDINLLPGRVAVRYWAAMGGAAHHTENQLLRDYINSTYESTSARTYWSAAENLPVLNENNTVEELITNMESIDAEYAQQMRNFVDNNSSLINYDSTIQQFFWASLGYPDYGAWCMCFVTNCFQNGVQGYFDIPYAFNLSYGADGMGPHAIDDPGLFGTLDVRTESIRQFMDALSNYTGETYSYNGGESQSYEDFDSWWDAVGSDQFAYIHNLAVSNGIQDITGSGFIAGHNIPYSTVITTGTSSDFYIYELDSIDVEYDLDTGDIQPVSTWLSAALAKVQGELGDTDRFIDSETFNSWSRDIALCILNQSLFDQIPESWGITNIAEIYRIDDLQVAIWTHYDSALRLGSMDDNDVEEELSACYTEIVGHAPVTEDGEAAVVPLDDATRLNQLAQYSIFTLSDGSAPWNLYPPISNTTGEVPDCYLYTDYYHIDFFGGGSGADYRYLAGQPWQGLSERATLSVVDGLYGMGDIDGSPASEDQTINIRANALELDDLCTWTPYGSGYEDVYGNGPVWGDYVSEMYSNSSNLTLLSYPHTAGRYVPRFTEYLGADMDEAREAIVNDNGSHINSSIWDLIFTYGGNNLGERPLFNILAEIPQKSYDVWTYQGNCWNAFSHYRDSRWIGAENFNTGIDRVEPGDVRIRAREDGSQSHTCLIVDVIETNGTRYIITADGNGGNNGITLGIYTESEFVNSWLSSGISWAPDDPDDPNNGAGTVCGIVRTFGEVE